MNEREAADFVKSLDDQQLAALSQGIYLEYWQPFPNQYKARLERAAQVLIGKRLLLHEKQEREVRQQFIKLVDSLFTTDELTAIVQGHDPVQWTELSFYQSDEIRAAAVVVLSNRSTIAPQEKKIVEEEGRRIEQRHRERTSAELQSKQLLDRATKSLQKEPHLFVERMAHGKYPAEIQARHESERAIWREAATIILGQRQRKARQRLNVAIQWLKKVPYTVIERMENGIYPAEIDERQESERAIWRQAAGIVLRQRQQTANPRVERSRDEVSGAATSITTARAETPLDAAKATHATQDQQAASHQSAYIQQNDRVQVTPFVAQNILPHRSQQDRTIYHITHLTNLPSILASGCLWAESVVTAMKIQYMQIGYAHLKGRRMGKSVPPLHDHVVGDYVPFYFAPRSPMLYTIERGNVPGYDGGQATILHLTTSVEAVTAETPHWRFTEGNATSDTTRFFDNLADLDAIDWGVMASKFWSNSQEDLDRERRRQAEFLVHQAVPWMFIQEIGVMNEAVAKQVHQYLAAELHQPEIVVRRDWYY